MPILSHGETIASIIALVLAGIVSFALLAFIALRPMLDDDPAADQDTPDDTDGLDATVVLRPPTPGRYIPRHRRTEGATR